jgi:ABC-type lipoprotein release transport system permease subunit
MIFSIAWKNIWRSKIRSLVVILAIAFGLLAGVFAVGLMNGMIEQRLDAAVNIEVGSLQLHNVKYMENNEPQYTITNTGALMDSIIQMPEIKAVTKRFKSECMLSSNRAATGANIIGIVPGMEEKVSELYKYINDTNGVYLSEKGRNPIVISAKTAEKLKVHLRSKIIVNGVNKKGISSKASFRIVGIYKTSNSMFDQMNAFIRYEDMARIFDFDMDEAHEIVTLNKNIFETEHPVTVLTNEYTHYVVNDYSLLKMRNDSVPDAVYNKMKTINSNNIYTKVDFDNKISKLIGNEDFNNYKDIIYNASETGINVIDWKKASPDVAIMGTWLDMMLFIFVGIILLALGFGIVNTMLMVVLERTKELGMLMAIGMNRRKVFIMILLETVLLSLVGGFIGLSLGYLVISYFQSAGLDLTAFADGMESIGYNTLVYPNLDFVAYVQITIMVIVTGILASIYPARQATKLNPAEAVRSE